MRLVRELAPRSCLELGTGFGVSTAYQAAALELNGEGALVGLDVERMTGIARDALSALELGHRVELVGGMIEQTLARALELAAPVDFALLDADHTKAGTLAELDALAPHLAPEAVIVFDDINWTHEMRRASACRQAPRPHIGDDRPAAGRDRGGDIDEPHAFLPPDSPAVTRASALMAAGALRLARIDEPGARAAARALRATAWGRLASDEREWIQRVESRRSEIPFAIVAADGDRDPGSDGARRLAAAWETCRWTSIPAVWGRFLTRLVRELAPRSCLELGTGLGLSAAYQAGGLELSGAGELVSVDAHEASRIAERGIAELGLEHRVTIEFGQIDDVLADLLGRIAPIDYALLDADHSEVATVRHFDALLPELADGAVVALDDITQTDGIRAPGRRSPPATASRRRWPCAGSGSW